MSSSAWVWSRSRRVRQTPSLTLLSRTSWSGRAGGDTCTCGLQGLARPRGTGVMLARLSIDFMLHALAPIRRGHRVLVSHCWVLSSRTCERAGCRAGAPAAHGGERGDALP